MRIMALDIGETRVGVAVSDPGERVASPVAVLPAAEVLAHAKPFQRLDAFSVQKAKIAGIPLNVDIRNFLQQGII